jgi:hypothetical protein
MKRRIESICNRHFARTLFTAAVGAVALGVMVTPALADVVVYGSSGYYVAPPATVYTPAPTYTYTYTEPSYVYPPPAYTYVPARGPGFYVDTPVIGFGLGFH